MLKLRTILVAADFSASSIDAFRMAQSLARDSRARILVAHVAMPPALATHAELQRALELKNGYPRVIVERLKSTYPGEADLEVDHRLLDGDPAVELLATARESNCDLIAAGTHGHTGLERLLLGSVAEQLVRKADCPVLTVKEGVLAARCEGAVLQEGK
jgi:nucleotide-binding universal stress UspA family protein